MGDLASPVVTTLRGRDLLSVSDFSAGEVQRVFATATTLKSEFRATRRHMAPPLVGRTLAMLFQKPSLRTRVSFEAGMAQLGGTAIYLPEDAVMGAREAIHDVAHNLIINGLTLREHPCQALADVFTIREHLGSVEGAVITFVGDGNNVYHSLALLGAALGMEIRLAHPPRYGPDERIVERAQTLAAGSGGRLIFGHDPVELVRGASIIYTDAWTSMGQEVEAEARRDAFAGYAVDDALLDAAGTDVRAMHCLPAHRGEEITSSVMDGPRSLIFEQSENRLHVQKALLVELLADA